MFEWAMKIGENYYSEEGKAFFKGKIVTVHEFDLGDDDEPLRIRYGNGKLEWLADYELSDLKPYTMENE